MQSTAPTNESELFLLADAGWIVNDEGEITGIAEAPDPETAKTADEQSKIVDWYMQTRLGVLAKIAGVEAEFDRLESILADSRRRMVGEQTNRLKFLDLRYLQMAKDWSRVKLDGLSVKSVKTAFGVLKWKATPKKRVITNEDAIARSMLKSNPEVVSVTFDLGPTLLTPQNFETLQKASGMGLGIVKITIDPRALRSKLSSLNDQLARAVEGGGEVDKTLEAEQKAADSCWIRLRGLMVSLPEDDCSLKLFKSELDEDAVLPEGTFTVEAANEWGDFKVDQG